MILKKIFNPITVLWYMWGEIAFSAVFAFLAYFLYENGYLQKISIPFSIAGILGSALAIFLAFRNNNSYSRWWEARTIWGNILNNNRIFARLMITNIDNAVVIGKATKEQAESYKKVLIYRQIAFAHALRLHLRNQFDNLYEFKHLLPETEYNKLKNYQNIPNMLLYEQSTHIKEGLRKEMLGAFDNISIEPVMSGFNNFQGACERIKQTPLLRHYHFFTKVFLLFFMAILPFALVMDFMKMGFSFLVVPASILISFVFGVMGKVGEVNEDPFENRTQDVPITSICNMIERDLKEMLEESPLPEKFMPQNQILF